MSFDPNELGDAVHDYLVQNANLVSDSITVVVNAHGYAYTVRVDIRRSDYLSQPFDRN